MSTGVLTRPAMGVVGGTVGAGVGWVVCFITTGLMSPDMQPLEGSMASALAQCAGPRALFSLRLGATLAGLAGGLWCLLTAPATAPAGNSPILKRHCRQHLSPAELHGSYVGGWAGMWVTPVVVAVLFWVYWASIRGAADSAWRAGLTGASEAFCAFFFGIWFGGLIGRHLGRALQRCGIETAFIGLVVLLLAFGSQARYWAEMFRTKSLPWG